MTKPSGALSILLGQRGVSNYETWCIKGPMSTDIEWIAELKIGVTGNQSLLVVTRKGGGWEAYAPLEGTLDEITRTLVRDRENFVPPNTFEPPR